MFLITRELDSVLGIVFSEIIGKIFIKSKIIKMTNLQLLLKISISTLRVKKNWWSDWKVGKIRKNCHWQEIQGLSQEIAKTQIRCKKRRGGKRKLSEHNILLFWVSSFRLQGAFLTTKRNCICSILAWYKKKTFEVFNFMSKAAFPQEKNYN